MKRSPGLLSLGAFALVAAVGLNACSSGSTTGSASSAGGTAAVVSTAGAAAPSAAQTKADAAPEKAQEVTFWGSWSSADQVSQLTQQVAAFNTAQSKYVVTYVPQELVEAKLLTGLASGQVPDVVLWDRYQTSLYVPKGALASIDDQVKRDQVDLGQFYDQALGEMKVKDKLYGLPLLVDNRSLLYNKALFEKAGVTPPTTWNELKTAAEKLTVNSGGKLTQAGFSLEDPGLFNMWLAQAGGTPLNADNTKTAFNSPQGLEVLKFWKSLTDAGVYKQGFGAGVNAFAQGNLAMKYDGPWALADLDKVTGLDYGIVPPMAGPTGGQGTSMGGFGLIIPKGAKNSEGAWEFMKWWTTQPASGVGFAKISGWIPANKAAANDPYFTKNEHYAAFIKALSFAKVRSSVPGYSDVEGKALIPALEKYMSGELTAEQALEQAQKQGDQLLQANR